MLAGIAFNTVASLTAIGLWIASPGRSGPAQCPPEKNAPIATAPPPRTAAPRAILPPNLPLDAPPRSRPRDAPELAENAENAEPPVNLIAPSKNPTGLASPALLELTSRLNLNPQVVAAQLGDETGELPKPYAERLERGFNAAGALAQRHNLDEGRSQSLAALVTFHVLNVLREEKKAAPSAVDPARIKELERALGEDVRISCGEDVARDVERAIADL
jgi:hypothetical protein